MRLKGTNWGMCCNKSRKTWQIQAKYCMQSAMLKKEVWLEATYFLLFWKTITRKISKLLIGEKVKKFFLYRGGTEFTYKQAKEHCTRRLYKFKKKVQNDTINWQQEKPGNPVEVKFTGGNMLFIILLLTSSNWQSLPVQSYISTVQTFWQYWVAHIILTQQDSFS